MDRSILARIWSGTADKRTQLKYLLVIFAIYIAGAVYAAAVYPGGFSFWTVYVSYLGGYPNNPNGYIVYNTCVIISGVLLIPQFIYLYKRLDRVKLLSFLACAFGVIGSIGFSFVGIYYQGTDPDLHRLVTLLAFGGFGFNALILLPVLLVKLVKKDPWPSLGAFAISYIVLFGTIGLAVYVENSGTVNGKVSEFIYLFVTMIWLLVVTLLPGDLTEGKGSGT